MMKNTLLYIFCLSILLLGSCRKDQVSEPIISISGEVDVTDYYTIDIVGIVKSEDGKAIEGASIKMLDQELISNELGVFYFEKIVAPDTGVFLDTRAGGFYNGGSSIFFNKNQTYNVEITLVPYESFIDFDAELGTSLVTPTLAEINIAPNSIADENGQLYTGMVNLQMRWLDPTAENTTQLAPGALVGEMNNNRQALITYGMIGVELFGENNEPLNILEGQTAELKFPLPNELQSSAPSEIDLWYFDETAGLWKAEGTAVLNGSVYEAAVKHFTWWNCDVPFDIGNICFELTDENQVPLSNVVLKLEAENIGIAVGNVGSNGEFCGIIPLNTVIMVEVISHCGTVIYEGIIGPYTALENLEQIQIEVGLSDVVNVTVSGQVFCALDTAIPNGVVVAQIGSNTYIDYIDENGLYSISFLSCTDLQYAMILTAYNFDNSEFGEEEILIGTEDIVQNLDSCIAALEDNTMLVSHPDGVLVEGNCIARITNAETLITVGDQAGADYVILGVYGFDTGTFSGAFISNIGSSINTGVAEGMEIIITQYSDTAGEQIKGTFTYNDISGQFVATVQ